MATKKFIELKEFTNEELASELKETQVQYKKILFDHAIKGMDNPMVIREVRRDIARLKSEVRRREIAELSEAQLEKRSKIRERRR